MEETSGWAAICLNRCGECKVEKEKNSKQQKKEQQVADNTVNSS